MKLKKLTMYQTIFMQWFYSMLPSQEKKMGHWAEYCEKTREYSQCKKIVNKMVDI